MKYIYLIIKQTNYYIMNERTNYVFIQHFIVFYQLNLKKILLTLLTNIYIQIMKLFYPFVISLIIVCLRAVDTATVTNLDEKKVETIYEIEKKTVVDQGKLGVKVDIAETAQKPIIKVEQIKVEEKTQTPKPTTQTIAQTHNNENHTTQQKKIPQIKIEQVKKEEPPTKTQVPKQITKQPIQTPLTNQQALKQQQQIEKMIEEDNKLIMDPSEQAEEKIIEQQEQQISKEEEKELVNQLQQWIKMERQQLNSVHPFNGTVERFQFIVDSDYFQTFALDATKIKSGKSIFIQMEIFIDSQDSFTIPNNPAEGTYLEFTITDTKMTQKNRYELLAGVKKNVYHRYKRYYTPIRPNMLYLNFENYYSEKIFVIVQVEVLKNQIETLNLTTMDPFAKNLEKVVDQMKTQGQKRRLSYKWEWGFKELEDQRQSRMLVLTGIQLIAILITALVQMFCLRNLLDSRSIV